MTTLRYLLEKEFRQFLRNPFMPRLAVFFPLMVMLVLPWVTTMDIRHIRVAVVDNDHSASSQRLVAKIGASDYFTMQELTAGFAQSLASVEQGEVDVILEIPDRFEEELMRGRMPAVSIAANGVNAIKGSLGSQYLSRVVAATFAERMAETGREMPAEVVTVQNRYNPTLDYRRFMIPALINMLLVVLCGFLPALNMVSEKEIGTIEQINVTPVSRRSFTLAKLIPYWLIGLVALVISMLIAWAVYGLWPSGSIAAILFAVVLFILAMSAISITVANYSSTMQQSMFVLFFVVMIFMLMSGLFTPIESMPDWAQWITWAVPPRYLIEVLRDSYLKGAGFVEQWPRYAALAVFVVAMNLWMTLSYSKRA